MTVRLRAFGRTSAPAAGIVLFPGRPLIIVMVCSLLIRLQHAIRFTVSHVSLLVDDRSLPGVW